MPARISSSGFRTLRAFVDAYSLRKIALPSPSGTAMAADMIATIIVPTKSGSTPKLSGDIGLDNGRHVVPVKKFIIDTSGLRKNPIVSLNNEIIMPIVTRIEKKPQKNKIKDINFSFILLFAEI